MKEIEFNILEDKEVKLMNNNEVKLPKVNINWEERDFRKH